MSCRTFPLSKNHGVAFQGGKTSGERPTLLRLILPTRPGEPRMLILGFFPSWPSFPFAQILDLPSIRRLTDVRNKVGQVGKVPYFIGFLHV